MKKINVTRIILVIVALPVIHFSTGLFLSPWAARIAAKTLTNYSKAKITFDNVRVWPLTLACEVENLKVFDPENAAKRIVAVERAKVGLSLWGLLAKRAVVSEVTIKGADIDIEGAADGTYNIGKVFPAAKSQEEVVNASQQGLAKDDWFGSIKSLLEKRFSKPAIEQEKKKEEEKRKIVKSVSPLPHGTRVQFKRARDAYFLEIKNIDIQNAHVHFVFEDKGSVDIDDVNVKVRAVGVDIKNGVSLGSITLDGSLRQAGKPVGRLHAGFLSRFTDGQPYALYEVNAKDIDLEAIRFMYERSLPVLIRKGVLTIASRSEFLGDRLRSKNSILLRDHELTPKADSEVTDGVMPMPVICDALNSINPLQLNFDVGGSIGKPEFSGFKESLLAIVKPNIKSIGKQLQKEGVNFLNDFLRKQKGKNKENVNDGNAQ